jgi:hypothetical protein
MKAGISKGISPKTARHSFATIALDDGMPIHLVQEWLGHKSSDSTRVYTRITARALLTGAHVHNPLLKAFPALQERLAGATEDKSARSPKTRALLPSEGSSPAR